MGIVTLPGFIDAHVHLRDPGQTEKEDFLTGTEAALAGGFTTVIDMPNNKTPITTKKLLDEKIRIARAKIVCDIGFYFGSLGNNIGEFKKIKNDIFGIKLYLNQTTGGFIIDEFALTEIYQSWNSPQPILLHAEEDVIDMVRRIIKLTGKRTHICHVSSKDELSQIIKAKEDGLPITCGVTPHHLFLTSSDARKLGPYGHMKPYLKTKKDQEYLWKNLSQIDIIESDHAPHTQEEKESDSPPFGVPGLETTLPLLMQAESIGKIHFNQIISMLYTNPAKIFNIPVDKETTVEVDDGPFKISSKNLFTKSKWTPFDGMKVRGKVLRVFIRGKLVYSNGTILGMPGSGKILKPIL